MNSRTKSGFENFLTVLGALTFALLVAVGGLAIAFVITIMVASDLHLCGPNEQYQCVEQIKQEAR